MTSESTLKNGIALLNQLITNIIIMAALKYRLDQQAIGVYPLKTHPAWHLETIRRLPEMGVPQ